MDEIRIDWANGFAEHAGIAPEGKGRRDAAANKSQGSDDAPRAEERAIARGGESCGHWHDPRLDA
jgi:hypothetical protein